ncbi:MAG: TetR/AcrR family transcriptional regulator [Candidatus Thorarchaeota archaeon]
MSPKVTEEHKEKTRNRILTAAEVIFSKKGYYGASMEDIVHKSGLSKGAIYGYFESKEELFLSLQEKLSSLSIKELQDLLKDEESVQSKLERAAFLVFGSICDIPDEACRMDLEFQVAASRIVKMRNRLKKQYSEIINFIAGLIQDGVDNGELKKDGDPKLIATILVGAIGGLQTLHITTGMKLQWDMIHSTYIDIVMNGLLN